MNPKRGEYARNDEPTVQIAVRLPESLVARMDAERGSRSRASWLVEQLDPIAVAPRPAASVYDGATTNTAAASVPGCKHARKVRGASGLLRCQDCGALQRQEDPHERLDARRSAAGPPRGREGARDGAVDAVGSAGE